MANRSAQSRQPPALSVRFLQPHWPLLAELCPTAKDVAGPKRSRPNAVPEGKPYEPMYFVLGISSPYSKASLNSLLSCETGSLSSGLP